jgi:hypothetical protein
LQQICKYEDTICLWNIDNIQQFIHTILSLCSKSVTIVVGTAGPSGAPEFNRGI